VPGVARNLVVGQLRQNGRFYCCWHDVYPSSFTSSFYLK
jgi:hypothetical protein